MLSHLICLQYELKETGHTPELTTEHDGKEVPVKRQTAANRKPPLQKSRSLESDRQMDRRTVISENRYTVTMNMGTDVHAPQRMNPLILAHNLNLWKRQKFKGSHKCWPDGGAQKKLSGHQNESSVEEEHLYQSSYWHWDISQTSEIFDLLMV